MAERAGDFALAANPRSIGAGETRQDTNVLPLNPSAVTAGAMAAAQSGLGHDTPSDETPTKLVRVIQECLDDAKAENIVTIDLQGKSSIADVMIIASGRSNRHVGAIADQAERALKDNGFGNPRTEGLPHCDWVLIDAGDVVLHLFRPEVREFYNLEKMWQADRLDTLDTEQLHRVS